MATFFQLTPDPLFKENPNASGAQFQDDTNTLDSPKYDHVRRPVRGIVLKPETFVTIEVKTKDGKNLLLFDGGGYIEKGDTSYTDKYSNFLIQSMSEASMEKAQIVETFGAAAYVFLFGKRPTTLNISGILCNSADFQWKDEWWENYNQFLRGTKCVENNTFVQISYEDLTVGGYILSCNTDLQADPSEMVPFNFQLLVSFTINSAHIGSNVFPYYTPVNIEPDVVVLQNSELPQQVNTDNPTLGFFYNFVQNALKGNISLDFLYGSRAQTYTNYILNYITGSNLRIPVGYEASTLFDNQQTITYKYGTFTGYKSTEVKYGRLRDNTDEYIAQVKSTNKKTVYIQAQSAAQVQYAEGKKAQDKAKAEFAKYGINVEPPSKLKQLLVTGAFATAQLAGNLTRAKLEAQNPEAELLVNKAEDQARLRRLEVNL